MGLTATEAEPKIASPSEEEKLEAHVQRVLQSAPFVRADTLRKLLDYLWLHREKDLNEYAIATEALGRRAEFDPRTDASVRVQISRLRHKLKEFYETEGTGELFALTIPMGSHSIAVADGAPAPGLSDEPLPEQRPHPLSRPQIALILLCALLTILCSWLLWDRHRQATLVKHFTEPSIFWKAFTGSGAPIKIVLPTPVFFAYPNLPKLHVRDTDVNDFKSWPGSAAVEAFVKAGGPPKLDHSYTVTNDTLAAIDLAHYLDETGMGDQVVFEVNGDASMSLLEKSNVIAMGAFSTLHPFRDYLASMNFSLAAGEAWVENTNPAPGEMPRYAIVPQGDSRQIEPAIVAVLPARAPNIKLLIMQSRHTGGLVGMLTSKVGNSLFQKIYAEHGSPKYFEMVVNSETEGDHIIRSWPVALHPYTKSAPSGIDVTQ